VTPSHFAAALLMATIWGDALRRTPLRGVQANPLITALVPLR